MLCPKCSQEIQDNAIKCNHCQQLIATTQESKKHTVWYSLGAVSFALLAAFLSLVVFVVARGDVENLTPQDIASLIMLLCGSAVASLFLSFWAIRRKYTAWWLCLIPIPIAGWSLWLAGCILLAM